MSIFKILTKINIKVQETCLIIIFLISVSLSSNDEKTMKLTTRQYSNTTLLIKLDDEYLKFFENLREITGIYLFPFIGFFGIIGNIFIAIVYSKSKKYSTNLYLIALSFSDIMKLMNDLAYFLVTFITKFNPRLGEKLFFILYRYSHYIFVITSLNTSWLTCAISIDRYYAVVKYNRRKIKSNYLQSFTISMFIFMSSIIIGIPAPLFHETIKEFDPIRNETIEKITETNLGKSEFKKFYQFLNGIFRAVLPLFILVVLNMKIIQVLVKTKLKNKNRQRNRRITYMLVTIVLTFVICIFPDAIMTMMQLGYANENSLVRGIREITDLLLAINSASTFPICFYFSVQFRLILRKLFTTDAKISSSNINDELQNFQIKRLRASRRSKEKKKTESLH